jgi:hypothetical protein
MVEQWTNMTEKDSVDIIIHNLSFLYNKVN